MVSKKKMQEYISRIEKCIPEAIRSIHTSIPKDFIGLRLNVSQAITLLSLGYKEPCNMSELADSVSINMSTMTGVVDELIKMGLIERTRSIKDRRVVIVKLTSKGGEILEKVQEYRNKELERVIGYLDEEEREVLIRGFEKVIEAFAKRNKEEKLNY